MMGLASGQVFWQTASNSITWLTAYLCNKSWEMWSWSPIPCLYRETRFMGDAERSWNCAELKELVLPNRPIQLSKEGPSLWIRSCLCYAVSTFSLHCRLLSCFSLFGSIWCHIQGLGRPFFRCTNKSWQLPLETRQQNNSKHFLEA